MLNIETDFPNRRIFLDGGTGTLLLKQDITCEPVTVNITQPNVIIELHKKYLEAGANIITANTFGAYSHKHDNFGEMISAAIKNAKTAVAQHKNEGGNHAYVALDIGPTGLMLEPYGDVEHETAADIFADTISIGVECGADCILIETMMDINELEIAVREARKTSLPVFATMSIGSSGRTMYGASVGDMAALLDHLGVSAMGINCGEGPDACTTAIEALLAIAKVPVIFQPNAGMPEVLANGQAVYNISPSQYAAQMLEMAAAGVAILGGCCGTTPEHIHAMVAKCSGSFEARA